MPLWHSSRADTKHPAGLTDGPRTRGGFLEHASALDRNWHGEARQLSSMGQVRQLKWLSWQSLGMAKLFLVFLVSFRPTDVRGLHCPYVLRSSFNEELHVVKQKCLRRLVAEGSLPLQSHCIGPTFAVGNRSGFSRVAQIRVSTLIALTTFAGGLWR